MSEATSKTCEECGGRGFRGVKGGLCATCNGTGIVTTGKILGTLPSTPDPVTDEPHEPTITTTQGDAPSVVTGNGLRYVYAPGHDSGATATDERDATIAEQAAEIERLRGDVEELTIHRNAAIAARDAAIANTRPLPHGLDDAPRGYTDGCRKSGMSPEGSHINPVYRPETRGDYATAAVFKCNSKECGGLSLESGLFEGLCACGASVTEVRDVSKDQYRRMCAQAAEIESLGQTVVKLAAVVDDVDKVLAWIVDGKACDKATDVLGEESTDDGLKLFQIVAGYKALASQHETLRQQLAEATLIDAPELRTERDTLRLEVQRLKDERFEAQDRYAALEAERDALKDRVDGLERLHGEWADGSLAELTAERDALRLAVDHLKAERDELKGKLDVQQEFIDDYRKTIDRLRTEVERLKGERDSVKHNFASLVAATEQGVDRIRAEKYLAVIAAQNEAIAARIQCHEAEITAAIAAHEAGLSLSRDPKETPMTDERGER